MGHVAPLRGQSTIVEYSLQPIFMHHSPSSNGAVDYDDL